MVRHTDTEMIVLKEKLVLRGLQKQEVGPSREAPRSDRRQKRGEDRMAQSLYQDFHGKAG